MPHLNANAVGYKKRTHRLSEKLEPSKDRQGRGGKGGLGFCRIYEAGGGKSLAVFAPKNPRAVEGEGSCLDFKGRGGELASRDAQGRCRVKRGRQANLALKGKTLLKCCGQ